MAYSMIDAVDQMKILENEIKYWEAQNFQLTSRAKAAAAIGANPENVAHTLKEAESALKLSVELRKQLEELEHPKKG